MADNEDSSTLDISKINRLLITGLKNGASDIHFRVGESPLYRVDGSLKELKYPPLTKTDTLNIARELIKPDSYDGKIEDIEEYDGTYIVEGKGQFRMNVYKQLGRLAIILRVIPFDIPSFKELRLPSVLSKISNEERGLILVTGATGQGKSTTVASLIDFINQNKKRHILTVEDPVEFIFVNKKSSVSQREVGSDTASFHTALKSAMRQDPDVIFVGEMREKETIEVVLKAAETGHLVISTIHTPDCPATIGRIVGVFPADEQPMARVRLAENLKAIVSQRLLPMKDGKGRIVAAEVLINTKSIQECIRKPEKMADISGYIEKGDQYGMQTFDQHLTAIYKAGKVSMKDAKEASSNPADFERNLTFD